MHEKDILREVATLKYTHIKENRATRSFKYISLYSFCVIFIMNTYKNYILKNMISNNSKVQGNVFIFKAI